MLRRSTYLKRDIALPDASRRSLLSRSRFCGFEDRPRPSRDRYGLRCDCKKRLVCPTFFFQPLPRRLDGAKDRRRARWSAARSHDLPGGFGWSATLSSAVRPLWTLAVFTRGEFVEFGTRAGVSF
jgi:hypothetical protein